MNETMVTVTGNVAGDVISRRVGSNEEHLLVTFRVASSERRWDKASESWIDGDRFTASVNCWRRLAEGARSSLVKGDPVVVTGRLSVREYETEAGRRYMTEISATAVGPDLARCSAEVRRRWPEGGEGSVAGEAGTAVADSTSTEGEPVTTPPAAGDASIAAVGEPTAPVWPVEDGPEAVTDGATVTGIGAGDRRRAGPSRASA